MRMRKNRKYDREMKNTLNIIKENSQTIAENTGLTNEKLDDMKSDIGTIKKSSTSKLPTILTIIGLLISISGVSVWGIWHERKTATATVVDEPEYTIYLHSKYNKVQIGAEDEMTATLNFETDAVTITAHLASGGEDTVDLDRKNEKEWKNIVEFTETGVHEIVATATAPDGSPIESSIEVEVVPVSMDIDMNTVNQLLFGE